MLYFTTECCHGCEQMNHHIRLVFLGTKLNYSLRQCQIKGGGTTGLCAPPPPIGKAKVHNRITPRNNIVFWGAIVAPFYYLLDPLQLEGMTSFTSAWNHNDTRIIQKFDVLFFIQETIRMVSDYPRRQNYRFTSKRITSILWTTTHRSETNHILKSRTCIFKRLHVITHMYL